jgi:hypothetical protein
VEQYPGTEREVNKVPHKITEQRLHGACQYNNKLGEAEPSAIGDWCGKS